MKRMAAFLGWVSFLVLALTVSSLRAQPKGDYDEAIQATSEGFNAAKSTATETKEKLDKALETYKTIKEYVSGAKGTELVDRLYASRGITDHTKVTELRGKLQDVVRALDQAGIERKLEHASKVLEQFDGIAGPATDALAFMDRFNPEGARGDPTRGLRTIGAAIEDAAGGLPWPMDEIFKEYAQTTTAFSKKLDDLQQKIQQNTRQGSLGGSYASYAEAQEFFEKNFEGKDGRTPSTFLDVSYVFPLLGRSVQVFQNVGDSAGEFYIFSLDDARGSLVPPAFATVYRYFAALPDLTVVAPANRAAVLAARATSNTLPDQIAEAEQLRRSFEEARLTKEQLLRAHGLWDTLGVLLLYGGDAFVGFFLLDPEKHAEIIKIRDVLASGGELRRVRVLVIDDEEGDPIPKATVTLGKFIPLRSGDGSAEFDLPLGSFEGSATAPKYETSGFVVTVAAPNGLQKAVNGVLQFAAKAVPALSPEMVHTVKLKSTEKKTEGSDAGAEESDKFSVLLGAGKTELDSGEKTTVSATVKNGKPPLQFQWSIDGLAMPGRNEPTLPITFGKLGTHSIGVSVRDSSTPALEAAASIDLFVGKTNDPDLVGRWSGTAKILEFKSDMPEVDALSVGKTGPALLWIAPNGTGGLKVLSTGPGGYFCHPSEQVVRDGQRLGITWQGPSALMPQSEYLSLDVKCQVSLELDQGRLKGTLESTATSTLSLPHNPVQVSTAHTKSVLDVEKISKSPGPPPATMPLGAAPAGSGTPTGAPSAPHSEP